MLLNKFGYKGCRDSISFEVVIFLWYIFSGLFLPFKMADRAH